MSGIGAGTDLFRSLFETAPDAMIVVDRAGHIALANPQAERLFGYASGELAGQPVEVLVPEAVRGAHVHHRNGYMGTPRVRPMGAGYELTGVRRTGESFPVEIGLSPIRTNDGTLFAASIRDISETRRVRQALVRARHDTFAAQIGRLALEASSYDAAVEILGSDRLMFGSNFPIEKLWTSHAELMAAHRAAAAKHSAADQANIFWNTAEKVYRPV